MSGGQLDHVLPRLVGYKWEEGYDFVGKNLALFQRIAVQSQHVCRVLPRLIARRLDTSWTTLQILSCGETDEVDAITTLSGV